VYLARGIGYAAWDLYSPSPSGRWRGEGQVEVGRALAGPMRPEAEVKTVLGMGSRECEAAKRVYALE